MFRVIEVVALPLVAVYCIFVNEMTFFTSFIIGFALQMLVTLTLRILGIQAGLSKKYYLETGTLVFVLGFCTDILELGWWSFLIAILAGGLVRTIIDKKNTEEE